MLKFTSILYLLINKRISFMTINDLTNSDTSNQSPILNAKPPIVEELLQIPTEAKIQTSIYSFPTELVDLPSKGLLYSSDSPLSKGQVEMKYMTTAEEDILSTTSYIKNGTVLDKLFQAMLVTKFKYDDLLLGDRNAIMVAARIYGYGPIYETKITNSAGVAQPVNVDLTQIQHKEIDESLLVPGTSHFKFTLPSSKQVVEFQLLTVGIQKQIEQSLEQQKKYAGKGQVETNLTTRLRYMIKSIDGNTDVGVINSAISNMRAIDSRSLREFIGKVQPDVDLKIEVVDEATGEPFRSEISLGLDLFWPDFKG